MNQLANYGRSQILCDLSFLRRRVAAGMLDLHIDDCRRALQHFSNSVQRNDVKSTKQNGANGHRDLERRGRLEVLQGRLQEMTDFLVADRELMVRMPALVAQQAANQPAGSAPEIAGLFALDRSVAGQEILGAQSQRAQEAEAANQDVRSALARYRPLSEVSLGRESNQDVASSADPQHDPITIAEVRVARRDDTKSESPRLMNLLAMGDKAVSVTSTEHYELDHLAETQNITSHEPKTSEHSESKSSKLAPEATQTGGVERADPRPQIWIEHLNKEAQAAAAVERQRISGVAWNGAVASKPRTSFVHVAISPDEVLNLSCESLLFLKR